MTQTELGQVINLSRASISGYELNLSIPDANTLRQIANVLDVSMDFLACNTDDPDQHLKTSEMMINGTVIRIKHALDEAELTEEFVLDFIRLVAQRTLRQETKDQEKSPEPKPDQT